MKTLYVVTHEDTKGNRDFDVRDSLTQILGVYQEKQDRLPAGTVIQLLSTESMLDVNVTPRRQAEYARRYFVDDSWETDWSELASTVAKNKWDDIDWADNELENQVRMALNRASSMGLSVAGMVAAALQNVKGVAVEESADGWNIRDREAPDLEGIAREFIKQRGTNTEDIEDGDLQSFADRKDLTEDELDSIENMIQFAKVEISFPFGHGAPPA